jgi:Cu+-exporting ATPase
MATTTLKVEGMTCGACTSSVEAAFQNVPGAGSVSVSLVMERVVVKHDPKLLSAERVREMIEDRGFDAEVLGTETVPDNKEDEEDEDDDLDFLGEDDPLVGAGARTLTTTTLSVQGMTCGACTSAVEGAFAKVAGVKGLSVSLLSERAVVKHDESIISPEKIAQTIEDAGFDAAVLSTEVAQPNRSSKKSATIQNALSTTVAIEGMTCGACTSAIESGFKELDGLLQFNISLLAERAVILHDPSKLSTAQIAEIIDDRGFGATIVSSMEASAQS